MRRSLITVLVAVSLVMLAAVLTLRIARLYERAGTPTPNTAWEQRAATMAANRPDALDVTPTVTDHPSVVITSTAAVPVTQAPDVQTAAAATLTVVPVPTEDPAKAYIDWGLWEPGVPWDMSIQDQRERELGRTASVIVWGQPWLNAGKPQPFDPDLVRQVRARGATPVIDWASWDLQNTSATNPEFQLSKIINGQYDDFIRTWATAARDVNEPLYVRFNWEMNGTWYPWSEQRNGNSPGEYVQTWKHVVDIFREVGATNVKWFWCPNGLYPGSVPLSGLYPGDDYVDLVGVDAYNWGPGSGDVWMSPERVFDESYAALRVLAPNMPLAIGETGVTESGGDKAAWITQLLSIIPERYPEVTMLIWFNIDYGVPNWRLDSSESATSAFRAGINSGYFRGTKVP